MSWIQAALYLLMGLFDRSGLQTNVKKTVGMVCNPYSIVSLHSELAYMRQMMGMSPSFWEWQRDIVWCPVCKVQLETGLLAYHHHAYHRT